MKNCVSVSTRKSAAVNELDMSLPLPKKTSLRHVVTDQIRDWIKQGTLSPGQKLSERELCARLEVSRTLLREALQQLQAEGLITNILHKGPAVAVLTKTDVKNIYEVREALEAQAARSFVLHGTDKQIDLLQELITELEDEKIVDDIDKQLIVKNNFYSVLFQGSENQIISDLINMLNNRISLLRSITMSQPGRVHTTVHDLKMIVAAARLRDAELMATLCVNHTKSSAKIALSTFE